MKGAVVRYRFMARLVGTLLLLLVFVAVPLRYAAHHPGMEKIVGPLHGFLYIVYLISALELAIRRRWTFLQLVGMVAAGLLPFLAFYMERRVTDRLIAEMEQSGVG